MNKISWCLFLPFHRGSSKSQKKNLKIKAKISHLPFLYKIVGSTDFFMKVCGIRPVLCDFGTDPAPYCPSASRWPKYPCDTPAGLQGALVSSSVGRPGGSGGGKGGCCGARGQLEPDHTFTVLLTKPGDKYVQVHSTVPSTFVYDRPCA